MYIALTIKAFEASTVTTVVFVMAKTEEYNYLPC